MGEPDYVTRRKKSRAVERRQLTDPRAKPPTLAQFWTQPNGVNLLFLEGDFTGQIAPLLRDRSVAMPLTSQSFGKMLAYPAHAGTLLGRRKRGWHSVAFGTWFSHGWTKVLEARDGHVTSDERQVGVIARTLGTRAVGVYYDEYGEAVSLIRAAPGGAGAFPALPAGLPKDADRLPMSMHPPSPDPLADGLRAVGIDVRKHVTAKVEMKVIINSYG